MVRSVYQHEGGRCFDIVLVGAGYRAVSFLASHPELLNFRVALFEQCGAIGPGAFATFDELSTSDGKGFFRHVDPQGEFGWIYSDPSTARLTTLNKVAPLSFVDAALRQIGSAIGKRIGPDGVRLNTSIDTIWIDRDRPGSAIVLESHSGQLVRTKFCILATGRTEVPAGVLEPWSAKTMLSSAVLSRANAARCREIVAELSRGRIVIAGGSHSAFSVAMKIKHWIGEQHERDASYKPPVIVIAHRGKFRLYASSKKQAEMEPFRDGVERIDPQLHICKLTGTVFRDTGLRHASRQLCGDILDGKEIEIRHEEFADLHQANELFERADLIIQALGYRGNYPIIADAGSRNRLAEGRLRTSSAGIVIGNDGESISNLAAIRVEPTPKHLKDHGAYASGLYGELARAVCGHLALCNAGIDG